VAITARCPAVSIATYPPTDESNSSIGIWFANPKIPSSAGEPVNRYHQPKLRRILDPRPISEYEFARQQIIENCDVLMRESGTTRDLLEFSSGRTVLWPVAQTNLLNLFDATKREIVTMPPFSRSRQSFHIVSNLSVHADYLRNC